MLRHQHSLYLWLLNAKSLKGQESLFSSRLLSRCFRFVSHPGNLCCRNTQTRFSCGCLETRPLIVDRVYVLTFVPKLDLHCSVCRASVFSDQLVWSTSVTFDPTFINNISSFSLPNHIWLKKKKSPTSHSSWSVVKRRPPAETFHSNKEVWNNLISRFIY